MPIMAMVSFSVRFMTLKRDRAAREDDAAGEPYVNFRAVTASYRSAERRGGIAHRRRRRRRRASISGFAASTASLSVVIIIKKCYSYGAGRAQVK